MSHQTPAAQWREKGEADPHGSQYDCERAKLTLGHLSDDELANGAFMNYDQPMDITKLLLGDKNYHTPIAWMTAVKERIRWLSRALVKAESDAAKAESRAVEAISHANRRADASKERAEILEVHNAKLLTALTEIADYMAKYPHDTGLQYAAMDAIRKAGVQS